MIKTYEDWENSLDQNYVRQLSPDAWDLTGSAFEAGQQAQQAKIDELQARIDEVLDYVGDDFTDYYTGVMIESIHEILKGNKDEN